VAPGESDYALACSVSDFLGLIDFGGHQLLVLGDEPLMTTWVPGKSAHGGMFARWYYGESRDSMEAHLDALRDPSFAKTDILLRNVNEPLYLFDSATPGDYVGEDHRLCVDLQHGPYIVETAKYDPDKSHSLLLHRLTPAT
jgi:hypothetical protein